MRILFTLALFIISCAGLIGQNTLNGKVISAETGAPLAYASVKVSEKKQILTNIDGSFSLQLKPQDSIISVSYIGFTEKKIAVTNFSDFYLIRLQPFTEDLSAVMLYSEENPADKIVRKAIENKDRNDPEKALNSFNYKSYNKFIIDNESSGILSESDTSNI